MIEDFVGVGAGVSAGVGVVGATVGATVSVASGAGVGAGAGFSSPTQPRKDDETMTNIIEISLMFSIPYSEL
ncbi:MAG: hypothetical protein Q8O41_11905 [Candidatus Methanoperedens sp.]|nr:hypothetical protein [Candidatus Methanoperedens sp.]